MTVVWHVDDVKASHKEEEVSDEHIDHLCSVCDDEEIGTLKVNCGPRHEFPGMVLDHSTLGKLTVDVSEAVSEMAEEFERECELPKSAKTPAADHSFKVNPNGEKLNKKMAGNFHTDCKRFFFLWAWWTGHANTSDIFNHTCESTRSR